MNVYATEDETQWTKLTIEARAPAVRERGVVFPRCNAV